MKSDIMNVVFVAISPLNFASLSLVSLNLRQQILYQLFISFLPLYLFCFFLHIFHSIIAKSDLQRLNSSKIRWKWSFPSDSSRISRSGPYSQNFFSSEKNQNIMTVSQKNYNLSEISDRSFHHKFQYYYQGIKLGW